MMANDFHHAGIVIWVERSASDRLPDFMTVGEMGEHIAYVGQHLALNDGPDYMKWVFRKILNLSYQESFDYITTNGVHYKMELKDED